MIARMVERDERTTAVEGSAYRWSYRVLSFGLLAIIAIRGLVNHQSSWDLFGLLILGGAVNSAYQGLQKVLYKRWVVMVALTIVVGALAAVILAALRL